MKGFENGVIKSHEKVCKWYDINRRINYTVEHDLVREIKSYKFSYWSIRVINFLLVHLLIW